MTYEQYKRQVIRLAGKKKSHLIPGNDALYRLYELHVSPQEVVEKYCTEEAQRQRHNEN